jgi:hypothetical protein
MQPYQCSLVGLLLDIVGVLLLSVEAIKLENIRKLRTRFLLPFHDWVKPATIEFVDHSDSNNPKTAARDYGCACWLFTHAGSGAVTVGMLGIVLRHMLPRASVTMLDWFATIRTGWKVAVIAMLVILLPNVLIYVGEFWHYSVIWLTGGFVAAAQFVDRKTPDGTIGLIGVALALLGFVLQFVGTWLSRPK